MENFQLSQKKINPTSTDPYLLLVKNYCYHWVSLHMKEVLKYELDLWTYQKSRGRKSS